VGILSRFWSNKVEFLFTSVIAIDLMIIPIFSDPINIPKLIGLIFLAIFCVKSLFSIGITGLRQEKLIVRAGIVSIVFISALSIDFFHTDVKSIGFLGVSGRNLGFLTYLSLVIIFLFTAANFRIANLSFVFHLASTSNFIFATYGIIQYLKLDPIKWDNGTNPIILTLGNPDFAAAFLGLLISLIFANLFYSKSIKVKLWLIVNILLSLIVIILSHALQGLILGIMGISLVTIFLVNLRSRKLGQLSFVGLIIAAVVAVFGMLGKGPFSRLLYKPSVIERGYDWRAAWHMFKSNPILGVGLDRYGANFVRYRDQGHPLRFGYVLITNNSHNVFLQILATGGLLLFLSYILIILFVVKQSFFAIKNANVENKILVVGIFSAWIAYNAQSFISIENISLGLWGWILSGCLIGLSIKNNQVNLKNVRPQKLDKGLRATGNTMSLITISILLIFSLVTSIYLGQAENKFLKYRSIQFQNSEQGRLALLKIATNSFNSPFFSQEYKMYVALTVTNSGLQSEGLKLFKKIVDEDPKRYDAHQIISLIYEEQKNYKLAIKHRLIVKSLNPYGADNLLELQKDYRAIGENLLASQLKLEISKRAPNTEISKISDGL
jgi:O-antigen ligase